MGLEAHKSFSPWFTVKPKGKPICLVHVPILTHNRMHPIRMSREWAGGMVVKLDGAWFHGAYGMW